jgi:hypothetical protein
MASMSSLIEIARVPEAATESTRNVAWKDATARAAKNRLASAEGKFISEIKPEVDAELDSLLAHLERGKGQRVGA